MDDSDGFTRHLATVDQALTVVTLERRSAITAAERCEADARRALTMATAYRATAAMRAAQFDALLDERQCARLDHQARQMPDLVAEIDSIDALEGTP